MQVSKYKFYILSFIIFSSSLLLLGFIYTNWGLCFLYEDPGFIWQARQKGFGRILEHFYESRPQSLSIPFMPSNYPLPTQSVFSVMYRPLTFVLSAIEDYFFGLSAYRYLVFQTVVHATNSALLFYVFSCFVSTLVAFWGSLFFAFHAGIATWHGSIACHQYNLNLLLLILIVLLLRNYLDSKNKLYYSGAFLLLLTSVFLRETLVTFPFWAIFAIYLYENYKGKLTTLLSCFKTTLPLWLTPALYIGVRTFLYPRLHSDSADYVPRTLTLGIFKVKELVVDLFGLSLIAERYYVVGLIAFAFAIFIFLQLFRQSLSKSTFLFFLAASIFIFSWPSPIGGHSSRHLYISLPFFILYLLCFFDFSKLRPELKSFFLILFSSLIVLNGIIDIRFLQARERYTQTIEKAFKEFSAAHNFASKAVCLVGVPGDFLRSVAHLVWLYAGRSDFPVYIDPLMCVEYLGKPSQNYLKIQKSSSGVSVESANSSVMWLYDDGSKFSMGGRKVSRRTVDGKVIAATFNFDNRYLKDKLLFVTWDFETKRLRVIG